ncbi:hypothetical protein FisN_19Hh254 [Fistulifera solaris]|uniref:Globin domain-containing protein n=1 Tax=Fistulifera solaris TaxID=1519565 RepID=A0A1Z5K0H9_FISSO|nr:hypothetical protein FisN_19Hh254 [Fistulifera solaris]|eukprot:GAX19669.1 hypothetical protein FisN_19Hh254 [Fistulifera solaris]
MVRELGYNTISEVLDSWEALRRIENYEEQAGLLLFRRLFDKSPRAKLLFGFPIDLDVHSDTIKNSRRFKAHAMYLIQMIDSSLNMLGPDIELLTEIMHALGEKHARFGVLAEMYSQMGDALIEAMTVLLGEGVMNEKVVEAWHETYGALSGDMIEEHIKYDQGE